MDEKINAVINNLCEKFGTTAEFLLPEITRYELVTYGFKTLVALTVFIIFLVFTKKSWKMAVDAHDSDSVWWGIMCVCIFVAGMILIFPLYSNGTELIGWLASPYGALAHMVLKMLK